MQPVLGYPGRSRPWLSGPATRLRSGSPRRRRSSVGCRRSAISAPSRRSSGLQRNWLQLLRRRSFAIGSGSAGRPRTGRWEYALSAIVWRLNGRQVHHRRGRRFVIAGRLKVSVRRKGRRALVYGDLHISFSCRGSGRSRRLCFSANPRRSCRARPTPRNLRQGFGSATRIRAPRTAPPVRGRIRSDRWPRFRQVVGRLE